MNDKAAVLPRYHRSPEQGPYPYKESEPWGTFVRYVELGADGYVLRQVDEFANGHLTRYDRTHWDDQFGSLADFRFGSDWVKHWGVPIVITQAEFEQQWSRAAMSPVAALTSASPKAPPPWLRHDV